MHQQFFLLNRLLFVGGDPSATTKTILTISISQRRSNKTLKMKQRCRHLSIKWQHHWDAFARRALVFWFQHCHGWKKFTKTWKMSLHPWLSSTLCSFAGFLFSKFLTEVFQCHLEKWLPFPPMILPPLPPAQMRSRPGVWVGCWWLWVYPCRRPSRDKCIDITMTPVYFPTQW